AATSPDTAAGSAKPIRWTAGSVSTTDASSLWSVSESTSVSKRSIWSLGASVTAIWTEPPVDEPPPPPPPPPPPQPASATAATAAPTNDLRPATRDERIGNLRGRPCPQAPRRQRLPAGTRLV